MNLRLTILAWLASLCLQTAAADTVKLPAVADTNISSHPAEADRNYGQSSHIRLKGHEMLMLV